MEERTANCSESNLLILLIIDANYRCYQFTFLSTNYGLTVRKFSEGGDSHSQFE